MNPRLALLLFVLAGYAMSRKGGSAAATTGSSTGDDESPEEKQANETVKSPAWPQGEGADWSSSGPQIVAGATGYSDWGLPDLISPATERDPYLDQLWDREVIFKSAIRGDYSIPRLKVIARAAAAYYGIPASWVWGILQGESNYYPLGIYAGNTGSNAKAKAKKSTAHGMGQMLGGRYRNSERKHWLATSGGLAKPHASFLDPKWSIWSTAAAYGRMAKNRGGGHNRSITKQMQAVDSMATGSKSRAGHGSLAVGHWWAGQKVPQYTKGAKAKVRQILKYGQDVWKDGVMRPSSSWHKTTPGVKEVDWMPPWKTGKLSTTQKFTVGSALSALEAAGYPLISLNSGLV